MDAAISGARPTGDSTPIPSRDWARQTWAVALYEFKRLRRGRHALARLVLFAVPVLCAVAIVLIQGAMSKGLFVEPLIIQGVARTAAAELVKLAEIFRVFDLPVVVFLATAILFGNLYNAEIGDRTLHHLFLAPVRREIVTLGKYIAGVITVFSATLAAWLVTCAITLSAHGASAALGIVFSAEGLRHVATYTVMLLLATLAYGALFLLVGAFAKSPILVAAVLWCLGLMTHFLPLMLKRLTIYHWVSAFMPAPSTPTGIFATVDEPENRLVAILVVLVFSGLCLALATWRARRIEVAYGAST